MSRGKGRGKAPESPSSSASSPKDSTFSFLPAATTRGLSMQVDRACHKWRYVPRSKEGTKNRPSTEMLPPADVSAWCPALLKCRCKRFAVMTGSTFLCNRKFHWQL